MPKKPKPQKLTARQKAVVSTKKLKNEVKKAVSTAIVAAFGFIIALAWRDVITEYVSKITAASPAQGALISALIVTVIAVIGILLVTRFLKVKESK